MTQPELGFVEHLAYRCFRTLTRSIHLFKKPCKPRCQIQPTSLCFFQNIVVRISFAHDLSRQTEQSNRMLFILAYRHIGQRTRKPPIAILKRMQRHKPQMRQTCTQQPIKLFRWGIEPGDKAAYFTRQNIAGRRFKMDFFTTGCTRDHPHRLISTQCPGTNRKQTRLPRWKKRRLPTTQTITVKGRGIFSRCIQQHFHQTIHRARWMRQASGRQSQMARNRRTDSIHIKMLTLNRAGIKTILGKNLRLRFQRE